MVGGELRVMVPYAGTFCAFSSRAVTDVCAARFYVFALPELPRDDPSGLRVQVKSSPVKSGLRVQVGALADAPTLCVLVPVLPGKIMPTRTLTHTHARQRSDARRRDDA